MKMKMRSTDFSEIDVKDLETYNFEPNQCVYGALHHKYKFDTDELFNIFNNFMNNSLDKEYRSFNKSSGVSSEMLLHLAKIKDFSLYGFDWSNNIFVKNVSKNRNKKPLIYQMNNDHFYLMNDNHISSVYHKNAERKSTNVSSLFRTHEVKTDKFELPIIDNVNVEDLKNYSKCNIMYSSNNIYDIIIDIYKIYNFQFSSKNIKLNGNRIIYAYFTKFDLYLHADINYDEENKTSYKDVQMLCNNLNIKFNNQSISSIMLNYEKMFFKLKSERIELSKDLKKLVSEQYDNKCSKCLKANKKFEYDHIIPLSAGGTSDIDNLQILCVECHFEKTNSEKNNSDYVYINPSESSFNSNVKQIFESDLCKTWAFIEQVDNKDVNKEMLKYIDINKTRRNILIYNEDKLPVYTVMDKVEEFKESDEIKTGMYYIETNNYFPLRGNGWYMYNTIKYCMSNFIITYENIKYKLIPSLTIEPDYFKPFLNSVVDKFGDKYSKLGPNSFIGCMNKLSSSKMTMNMTTSKSQALSEFYSDDDAFVKYDQNINLWVILHSSIIEFDESRTPIYKFVMEQEAIEMHKLYESINKINGSVYYFNTDCIAASFNNNNKINKLVKHTYWDKDKTIRKYKFEIKDVNTSIAERMKGKRRSDDFILYNKYWNETNDSETDDFTDLVKSIIDSNKSWLVNGRAGTGKSTFIKLLMKSIDNYIGLAPTNKACRIIDGETIHKFVACAFTNKTSLFKKLKNIKYIIIDEISMVKEIFYKIFISIKRTCPDIKFILVGDFKQLQPVKDRIENCDYEHSPALFELCDGNKLILNKCRRSDAVLFNLCQKENIDSITSGGDTFDSKFSDRHICFTNFKRIAINKSCMDKHINTVLTNAKKRNIIRKRNDQLPIIIKLKKLLYDPNSQDVSLLAGMPVIARINSKNNNIVNNQTFKIIKINNDNMILSDDETKEQITIYINEFQKLFYIAYAITCHKSQGCTFNFNYSIHEWDLFSPQMKYVALSRATNIKYINIMS